MVKWIAGFLCKYEQEYSVVEERRRLGQCGGLVREMEAVVG